MSDPLLTVRNLHTYYGDSYVLQGIDLQLHRGQVLAVLGRNGMGKTTLVRSIFGLTPARQGEVRLMGREISRLSTYRIAQMGMALVPQGRRIFRNLSVRENLLLPISDLAGQRRSAMDTSGHVWTLETVLDEFPQLRERLSHGGSDLSGGEQQMLAIARALIRNPQLVLMDEPSEGLSPLYVRHVAQILSRLRDLGLAVLLVEQNLQFARRLGDWVAVMDQGRVVHACDMGQWEANPQWQQQWLGLNL